MSKQPYRTKDTGSTIPVFIALVVLTLVVTGSSCKKFLASYSQNQAFLETAADLDELITGEAYNSSTPVWVNLLDDDTEENPSSNISGPGPAFTYGSLHHWQSLPFTKSDGLQLEDTYYTGLYRFISALNTVLYNIPRMREKGEPADTLQRISGEAHYLRANYYFILVNLYGKPYHTATASTDYGIPLKTDPAVEDKLFARNTVKQVYDQILSDLLASEQELAPFNQQLTIRTNQATAQALLSRVYLHMEDYENALAFANKVINRPRYRIANLNNPIAGKGFLSSTSPETIFYMPSPGPGGLPYIMFSSSFTSSRDNYKVAPDLKNSFSVNDLRTNAFFEQSSSGEFLTRKGGPTPDLIEESLVRLPELYLNKAEALAALGRNEEAVTALQELRKNRFRPEHLTAVTATGAELVNFIRDERRRELCFEWRRLFDLRRYGANTRYPFEKTIRHISYDYNNSGRFVQGFYELKPYSQDKAAYVLPIPAPEIEFNRGVLFNEERPARPLMR